MKHYRCCVYIATPDPAYEHDNYVNCSRIGTHVYKQYCLNCDHFISLSDALKSTEGGLDHDNQEST